MSHARVLVCTAIALGAMLVSACAVGTDDGPPSYDKLTRDKDDGGDAAPAFDVGMHLDTATAPAPCAAPKRRCDDLCVDTTSDPKNCGACGKACPAASSCVGSACTGASPPPPECPAGQARCGGTCIDVTSDAANCGSCGGACPTGWSCVKSKCDLACAAGTMDCGGGACVTLESDPRNCGGCGRACPGGFSCAASTCELVCSGDTTKCGGVCAKLSSDHSNCGACGNACSFVELCLGGVCWGL